MYLNFQKAISYKDNSNVYSIKGFPELSGKKLLRNEGWNKYYEKTLKELFGNKQKIELIVRFIKRFPDKSLIYYHSNTNINSNSTHTFKPNKERFNNAMLSKINNLKPLKFIRYQGEIKNLNNVLAHCNGKDLLIGLFQEVINNGFERDLMCGQSGTLTESRNIINKLTF